ncbi:hypothetical protein [Streptomyces nigrescens]|uniref:hypothetical protein n=1 Tax=Streptomyces nigrescens TaxID=1920 RepID=UPI0036F82E9B
MPEYYSSIGEAVGAAMQHNIRLAHGNETSSSHTSSQVRYLPRISADAQSVPGLIARVTETAAPEELAGIVEEVKGTLVGVLPQLTELVAAAADWTRARPAFDDPHHHPAFDTWTRLAAAHNMLRDVQEQLEVAADGIAACPAERTDPGTTRWSTSCGRGSRSAAAQHPPTGVRKRIDSALPAPRRHRPPPSGRRPRPVPRRGGRALRRLAPPAPDSPTAHCLSGEEPPR